MASWISTSLGSGNEVSFFFATLLRWWRGPQRGFGYIGKPKLETIIVSGISGAIDMLVLSILRTILRTSVDLVNEVVLLDMRLQYGKGRSWKWNKQNSKLVPKRNDWHSWQTEYIFSLQWGHLRNGTFHQQLRPLTHSFVFTIECNSFTRPTCYFPLPCCSSQPLRLLVVTMNTRFLKDILLERIFIHRFLTLTFLKMIFLTTFIGVM